MPPQLAQNRINLFARHGKILQDFGNLRLRAAEVDIVCNDVDRYPRTGEPDWRSGSISTPDTCDQSISVICILQ